MDEVERARAQDELLIAQQMVQAVVERLPKGIWQRNMLEKILIQLEDASEFLPKESVDEV